MISRRLGLAHPAEIHSLLFHLLVLTSYALAFWIYLHPEAAGIDGPASQAAFVAGAVLMLSWCSGINLGVNYHNQAHRPAFVSPWMNRWVGRTWGLPAGWSAAWWQYAHNAVHHAKLMSDQDWTLPRQRSEGRFENFFRYCIVHYPLRYVIGMAGELKRADAGVRRRLLVEAVWFTLLFQIPFWIDLGLALWLWVLPAYLANALVVGPGMFAQHAGRRAPEVKDDFVHSNVFTSRLFNMAFFNVGYHVEHHNWANAHWSELPALHEKVKERLIEAKAHVVPFGYFRAGLLLSRAELGSTAAREEFGDQHPDYQAV